MPQTYTPIASTTVSGTSTTTVTFNSISGSYTDLIVVVASNVAAVSTNNYMYMNYNNDSGTNYSTTQLYGNGTAAGSIRWTNRTNINLEYKTTQEANVWSQHIIQIQNYSNTTTYKTALCRAGSASLGTDATVGLWRSTAAITRLDITSYFSNFADGSVLTVYGIKAA